MMLLRTPFQRLFIFCCLLSGLGWSSHAQSVVTTLTDSIAASGGVTLHPTSGDLYVANFGDAFGTDPNIWGRDVKRITADGEVNTFATGFFVATGNDFAADDSTLLQVELGRGLVFRVAPDGTSTQWAQGMIQPIGIAAAPDGGAFVAECGGNIIRRIEPDGSTSVFAEAPEFNCPNGLTIDPDGNLYTVNFNDGNIFRIDTGGSVSLLATGPGGGNGHVAYAAGHLFVADRSGHQILRVGLDGTVEVIAGSGEPGNDDGPASEATFRFPNGIAVTPDGSTIYVNSKVSEDPNELNPILVRVISGIAVSNEIIPEPKHGGLLPVAPNPSRAGVTLRYELASPTTVELAVYDLMGRQLALLETATRPGGSHTIRWNGIDDSGRTVSSGMYLCRMQTSEGQTETRLFTLLR